VSAAPFADRLCEAVRAKRTPLCVGLDPRWESLPLGLRQRYGDAPPGRAAAYEAFCRRVLDLVAPLVGVVKPQSAFFEACGADGVRALESVIHAARNLGLLVILDAKRGDIASTAEAYAEAAFSHANADALTVNPYLGGDAVEPFVRRARAVGRGVFVLVRTSNPGGRQFQDLLAFGKPLYEHVAEAVHGWAGPQRGVFGLGDVGAVVGATGPAELGRLRRIMPAAPFLVPGYGAQGATAADTAGAFLPGGLGAVVNSSRGILFPYQPDEPRWEQKIVDACRAAATELAHVAGLTGA